MSGSPRPDRKGAAELTLKFRKRNEDLVNAFLPKSPWVQLLPQRSPPRREVLEMNTDEKMIPPIQSFVRSGSESPKKIKSPSEKMMEAGFRDQKSPEASTTSSSHCADSFHKLHMLCSSPTSSIEMIRM
jgi:hypothetical protein